jgi:hypothetical protein
MTLRTFLPLSIMMTFALGFLPAETAHAEATAEEALVPPAEKTSAYKNRHRKSREKKQAAGRERKEAEAAEAAKAKAAANSNSSSGAASLVCRDGKVVFPKKPTEAEAQRCARPIPKMKIVGEGALANPKE